MWYTRTEFWIALAAALGGFLAAVVDLVPAEWGAIIATASLAVYAISRGLAKWGGDMKRGYKTSEFWLAVLNVGLVVATAIPGNISAEVAAVLTALIAAAYTISRGIAKDDAAVADI